MNITSKVTDKRISEQTYRQIRDRLSYSSIKLFDNSRKDFYQQLVLGEKRAEKESIAVTMGSLVHLLLSLPESFDEKFIIAGTQRPAGQMGELVDNLITRAMKSIVNGVQQDAFGVLFTDAFNITKYDYEGNEISFKKKEMQWALEKFEGKEPEHYYKECMENIGKTVVSTATIESAERIVEKIKAHPYTAGIANLDTSDTVEVFNELPILFTLDGVEYKAMIDKIVVNHQAKSIQTYDWKTSWDLTNVQFAFLKYGYYLQSIMYHHAVLNWALENDLSDYNVTPMTFVFCDTQGFADPVLLELSTDDLNRFDRGFTYRGLHYNGLQYLREEIQHCLETGRWGTTRELERNNGKMKLKLRYGSQ